MSPTNYHARKLENPPPKAWLGYRDLNVVCVCAYCPDKAQADAEAIEAGQKITHSICNSCLEIQLEAL